MGVCSPSLLIAVRDRSDDGVGGIRAHVSGEAAAAMEAAWAKAAPRPSSPLAACATSMSADAADDSVVAADLSGDEE